MSLRRAGLALFVVAAACSPAVVVPPVARVDAPIGRLAGPPPALRDGVAAQPPPAEPAPPATDHHHGH